ncbi:MAG: hypothetical protein ABT940_14155 [Alphaproteobacteria bacterium]
MLGFSIAKVLFTVLLVGAVWFGFKYLGRLAELKADRRAGHRPEPPRSPYAGNARGPRKVSGVEDLHPCTVCGAYVASGTARACDRAGCPYG